MVDMYPVLDGAEPFFFEGNHIGILVIHGFTGTTQSMRGLGEALANTGFTVCGPRLEGHGTHYEDLEDTPFVNWIASVEQGYRWLKERCDTIIVTGFSMGGTLTLYLAEKQPEIKAIILINAAIEIPQLESVLKRDDLRFLDAIGSDIKDTATKELAYEKTPVNAVKELVQLMDQIKQDLHKIECPALIFVSTEDHVVPPNNSYLIYDNIISEVKEIVSLNNSYHVATLDYDKQLIEEKTVRFINKVLDI
jgi:carboxylesterase